MSRRSKQALPLAVSLSLVGLAACGGDDDQVMVRGMGGVQGSAAKAQPGSRRAGAGPAPESPVPDAEAAPVARPSKALTREDFGPETRDPFQNLNVVETQEVTPEGSRDREREVVLAEYNFGDLTLIGVVNAKRGVPPRALFKATDGHSKSVRQGEYFSRAEILLATVNRDYIEIEVVDDELAKGMNMERGERRAIYLKEE
jgi:Tfp pilus assembly protein PilP